MISAHGFSAIVHYCSKGNFRRAATQKQNLAELYEVELADEARAAAAYEEAAGWFESVSPESAIKKGVLLTLQTGQCRGDLILREIHW